MTTRTVIGQYVNIDGSPVKGYIEFTPSSTVAQGYIIPVSTVRVALDDTGSFSVDLPVTDDPIAIPVGWKWSVEEKIPNGNRWYFDLPTSVTPLNLADVVIIGDNEVPIYGVAGPKGDKGDTGNTGPMGEVTTAAMNAAIAASNDVANARYANLYGRNRIINGDFSVNQRAFTSTTTNSAYGFDRWAVGLGGGSITYSTQSPSPGDLPESARAFARIVTSQTDTDYCYFFQPIESVRTLSGKTATASFWAKAGSGTPKVFVEAVQYYGTGGSTTLTIPGGSVTLSTTWNRYSVTFSIPALTGKTIGAEADQQLQFRIFLSDGSGSSRGIGVQSNTFDFWGVQLEEGTYATPYEQKTYAEELRACQRYYYRLSTAQSNTGTAVIGQWHCDSSGIPVWDVRHPVTMRAGPMVYNSGADISLQSYSGGTALTTTLGTPSTSHSTPWLTRVRFITGWTGTAGQLVYAYWPNPTQGWIEFTAEL